MGRIRMAQYGTRHGHAAGKLLALRGNPRVDLVGVIEPDTARQAELRGPGSPYEDVRWFDEPGPVLEDATVVAVASEGRNDESLAQTEAIVRSGKHVWYD